MSRKPTIAIFAPKRPRVALSARPEYARYEGRPTPCRRVVPITKPIDQDSRDAA